MASLKTKGDLAELKVATDLLERGYRIAIPYGEDNDFDLILIRSGAVLLCIPDQRKGQQIKKYTSATIDWLAVYDATTKRCFYISVGELGTGMDLIHLRLTEARNGQRRGIRFANDYSAPEIRQLSVPT